MVHRIAKSWTRLKQLSTNITNFISRCKFSSIGWISSKVLLYSTGNSIRYPVINHNGKENDKEYV